MNNLLKILRKNKVQTHFIIIDLILFILLNFNKYDNLYLNDCILKSTIQKYILLI
jgi:hypothetical protein